MANPNQHKEAHKRPSVKHEVESLIKRKKAEKAPGAATEVSEEMAVTQEAAADVMAGVEAPKEGVSERKGESGEKGDISGAATSGDDDDATMIRAQLMDYDFPSQEIMVKKIRTAINAQIKVEWKNALKFGGKIAVGEAADYNSSIARIRRLKEVLSSMFTATVDKLKAMYVKYFGPDGKRRKSNDL